MSTAVKSGLCARCKSRRAAANVRTDTFVTRTSEDAPDVYADRDHIIRISTWATCSSCCSGKAS